MALTHPISNNIIVPAGRCYFAPETSATVEGTAFVYLGDNPSFTLGGSAETTVVLSSDDVVATELVNIPKSVTRSASMRLRNISMYNLSLFQMGELSTVTQTTGAGNTTITMAKDRYYWIGTQDITIVTGSGVKQTNSSGAAIPRTTTGGGVNWELDSDDGVIYFPTGTAATTGSVYIAYSKVASSWQKVVTGSEPVYGTLKFRSNNTAGDDYTIVISRCSLVPNGDAEFKGRDNPVELGYTIGLILRDGKDMVEMLGKPA